MIIGLVIIAAIICLIISVHTKKAVEEGRFSSFEGMDGHQFEHVIAQNLKKWGYIVEVTPGSGDYGVDIIVLKDGKKVGIQCKNWAAPVGVKAVQEVYSGGVYWGCSEFWIMGRSGYTRSCREMAKKLGVKLLQVEELR